MKNKIMTKSRDKIIEELSDFLIMIIKVEMKIDKEIMVELNEVISYQELTPWLHKESARIAHNALTVKVLFSNSKGRIKNKVKILFLSLL